MAENDQNTPNFINITNIQRDPAVDWEAKDQEWMVDEVTKVANATGMDWNFISYLRSTSPDVFEDVKSKGRFP